MSHSNGNDESDGSQQKNNNISRALLGSMSSMDGFPDVQTQSNGKKSGQTTSKTPVIDITKNLNALVAQQIKATPNALALEDDKSRYTYSQLDLKVEGLAHRLRDHGVGTDKLVGVLLGRSADYVIACLAAHRAGGAFLVLELAYPPGLLADVIDDAKPVVVVTNTAHSGQIKGDIPLVLLDV